MTGGHWDLGLPSSEKTGNFSRVMGGRKTGREWVCQGALFSNDVVKIPPWGGQHGRAKTRAGVSKVEGQLCFLYECPRP